MHGLELCKSTSMMGVSGDERLAEGDRDGLGARVGVELLHRASEIGSYGVGRDEQFLGHLVVRLAVGEQAVISDYTGLERIDRIDLKQ